MCKRPPATPGSPSRTSGKDWQRSTTRGNARGIHVPPPGAWSDGTKHLLFEPVEFLEKLAVLTPRPAINQILYHGVLAPHAGWRPAVVAYGRLGDAATAPPEPMGKAEAERGGAARSRYWTWAVLMRRRKLPPSVDTLIVDFPGPRRCPCESRGSRRARSSRS